MRGSARAQERGSAREQEKVAWSAIRCADCHSEVSHEPSLLRCVHCGLVMRVREGVVCCAEQDDFYEEAYLNEVRHVPGRGGAKDWIFFSLLQSGVFGKLRDVLRPGATVLDVGCASGVRWLGNYHTIGVDLSFSSVRKTSAFYELSVQARADRLPLASSSVDVVYSSYFFEHVPPHEKDACLAELSRVMRPGASCVLLFDVLSTGAFGRLAGRNPDAFRRGFIEPDGHIGLETLTTALSRLKRAGLEPQQLTKFGATPLQYMASYHWLDKAYGDTVPWIRWLGSLAGKVSASPLRLPVELAITAFDTVINRYTLPDQATRAIVVARK
jgi:SAM-dependent methyltransferase